MSLFSISTPVVTPLIGSTLSSIAKYFKDEFQQIYEIILNFKPISALAGDLNILQQYENPCKRPIKTQFPDVYRSKNHLKYYNYFQQYKNYFAILDAQDQNRVIFAATFFEDIALFY